MGGGFSERFERAARIPRESSRRGGDLGGLGSTAIGTGEGVAPRDGLDLRRAFLEHGGRIERFLARLGISKADSEDLMAETFLIAHRHAERYDAAKPIAPWLLGIAANLARRHRRRGWLWSMIRG